MHACLHTYIQTDIHTVHTYINTEKLLSWDFILKFGEGERMRERVRVSICALEEQQRQVDRVSQS